MPERKRVRVLFAMLIVIFLGLIGWTLLGLDSKKKEVKSRESTQEEEPFVMMLPEQENLA